MLTDQGTEFQGFVAMLYKAKIDHRMTAPNYPQPDGLAERAVQTMKRALRKHVDKGRQDGGLGRSSIVDCPRLQLFRAREHQNDPVPAHLCTHANHSTSSSNLIVIL